MGRGVGWVAIVAATIGCAKGSEEPEDYTLRSGEYELSTVSVEGTCPLEDAITPGTEFVGKLGRVQVEATHAGARFQACDDFFPDTCMPALEAGFEFSVIREEDELVSKEASWRVPFCWCSETSGVRELEGTVVEDDAAELTWTFQVPAAAPECGCEGWDACTATVKQRLAIDR